MGEIGLGDSSEGGGGKEEERGEDGQGGQGQEEGARTVTTQREYLDATRKLSLVREEVAERGQGWVPEGGEGGGGASVRLCVRESVFCP